MSWQILLNGDFSGGLTLKSMALRLVSLVSATNTIHSIISLNRKNCYGGEVTILNKETADNYFQLQFSNQRAPIGLQTIFYL